MANLSKQVIDPRSASTEQNRSRRNCVRVGDWVFLSSQPPTPTGDRPPKQTFEEQVRQAFDNIETALEAADSGLSEMVHMTVWLADMRYAEEFVRLRGEILGDDLTTSSLIGVRSLSDPNYLVEIEARAITTDSPLEKTVVDVPGLRDPTDRGRSYRHAITVGDHVYLAGQVPVDENHEIASHDFGDQVRATFDNIQTALEAAGSSLDDILHMSVWLRDIRREEEFVDVRGEILGDRPLSTDTLLATKGLGHPDYQLEIEVKALKSDADRPKEIVKVPELPSPVERGRSYELCVAAGDWVYLAGQVAFESDLSIPDGFVPQTEKVFANIETGLAAAGSGLEDIVHMRVYPADIRFAPELHRTREQVLGQDLSTSTLVDAGGLANREFEIEIEVIAVR